MNLKKYLDAANAAEARVQAVAAQIDQLMDAGNTAGALALKPQLDTAKAEAKSANEMYLAMRDVDGHDHENLRPVGGNVQVVLDEGDQPFPSDGHFFMAVKNAAISPAQTDRRLLKFKDATGMSEGNPAEGGFAVPQQTASRWIERIYTTGIIMSRISKDPVTNGNNMTYIGIDETSRADGSQYGGITGYWLAEGVAPTASKAKWYNVSLELKGVAALCYATNNLLRDVGTLGSWLDRTVPNVLRFKAEDAVYEGDGVGKPMGILQSPCLITVTREDANEISYLDLVTMWARRWAGGGTNYIWLYNQDCGPQLDQLMLVSGSAGIPPRFVDYGPDGLLRIKGRPAFEVEYAQTLGTKGDIMLADLSQYQAIDTGQDVQSATSIHVAFTTAETAFRFDLWIDGKPTWASDLTPFHGSNKVSPFVTLSSASA